MNCLNCRSHVLENWLYCPKCGKPTSLSMERSVGAAGVSQVSPWVVLENLTAGVLVVNARGRIEQTNAALRAIFGIQGNRSLIGKPYGEFIRHEECSAIIRRKLMQAAGLVVDEDDEDTDRPGEFSVINAGREKSVYQVHAANVYDDANAFATIVFNFFDVTERHGAAEFVSNFSHELRTPLTPMKGFIRTLLDDEKEEWYDRETRREFYTIINEQVDRLSRIINDLLNVRRIDCLGVDGVEMDWKDKVGLRKMTEDVLETQRGRTDKHTFVIDFEPEDIEFETDSDKMQHILQNFISNAIKYSEGGEIRIIARLKPADEDFPHDAVLIGVKDYGIGMPPAFLKKVGKKFVRADNAGTRKGGGIGIGLYLVKALIAAHKGIMTAESEPNKGSTFWIRLPLRQPEPDEAPV